MPRLAELRRFLRTPKGLLLIVLTLLAAVAAAGEGVALLAPGLAVSIGVCMLLDAPLLWIVRKRWEFPSGALLTGLIVAMVLTPYEPWYVPACTCAIAIVSKHVFRTRTANVFNPAAVGIVATFYVFDAGENWWGALTELSPLALVVLFAAGIFIADRINKLPIVLAFLGSYYLLFTVTAFLGDPRQVAEVYRTPDLQAALFFACFILTDPPTSPVKYRDQIVCGAIVGATSYATFELAGPACYLLVGVLVGNLWEAWRRTRLHRMRPVGAAPSPLVEGYSG